MTKSEDWPKLRYESGCGCGRRQRREAAVERLARESLSVALRHAQDPLEMEDEFGFEAATPGGTITLPGTWSGWRHATPILTVLGGGGRPEFKDGRPRLYRIYEPRKQKPIYIGMAYRSTIQRRIGDELNPARPAGGRGSEIQRLRDLVLVGVPPKTRSDIMVQYGWVTPHPPHQVDAKLLHAFELALAYLERPHTYNPDIWSFEED